MNEDRGRRYHRLRRRATVLAILADGAWFLALAMTGWGSELPLVLFVALIAAGWEVVSFPFTFYRGFLLDRRYGLTSVSFRAWAIDELKGFAIGLAFIEVVAWALLASMRLAGNAWWAVAAFMFAGAGVILSQLVPVVLMPLFYRFRPLQRDDLRERLIALCRDAGVPVLGVFEWGLSEKTSRANAALTGAGPTRRILVSDTLLNNYSDDEIEVILAHELAHHVHHDLWTALGLETGLIAVTLLIAHLAITASPYSVGNPAALPLLMLVAGAVSLALTPIGYAWSRRNERRADRFALELTGRRDAFVSAMRRLATQNLAEPAPSRAVRWFFHSHPTIEERIAAARPQ